MNSHFFIWTKNIYIMQSQLSLYFFFFWYLFSFRYCSNGCFSSIHNVNDPSVWNGFPVRAERSSQDWITGLGKDLGLFGVTGSIVAPCLPCESDLWPAEGAISPQMASSARWSLLSWGTPYGSWKTRGGAGLSPFSYQAEKWNDMNLSSHNLNGSTSSTRPLFHTVIAFLSNNENWTRISSHQQRNHAAHPTLTGPHISSVLLFMLSLLKAFSYTKKKKRVKIFWWILCCD